MHSAFNLTACTFWSCCLTPFVATSLACTCFAYHCCRWTKNLMHTVPKWSNLPHKNRVSYVYGWSRCNSIQNICILYILYNIYIYTCVCKQKSYYCIRYRWFLCRYSDYVWDSVHEWTTKTSLHVAQQERKRYKAQP